jgi:hypothetical protein
VEFEKLSKSGTITVDWNASPGIMHPSDYVEKWRLILWEKAFLVFVHPNVRPPFLKGTNLDGLPQADLVIQRLLYRLDTSYTFDMYRFKPLALLHSLSVVIH